ncbi:env [Ovine enzootic nasal tumor virus]|uniref:env n=3 Tax=Ovine enzootic nasal tumor virus TaxID=69576 RepID=UPI0000102035|nr:env [Ovine enzootic nasal tumor virus]CAB41418.1 env [Ovine enzootic nasal tumor virus]
MPKHRAGFRKGWYARQRNSLTYQMQRMTLNETTNGLPTQRQVEALMRHAWNEAHVQPPATPIKILIMLLLLLQRIQNGAAAAFWAYIPDPPMIQSLGWDREIVPVYVNDTSLLGGKSDIHISPQQANISFYGLTTQYPMCFSYQSQHPHCIQVSADISYPRVTISGIDEKTGKRSYRNGTGPLDIPFCDKNLSISIGIDTPWTLCRARIASVYNINNANTTLLWDWAPGGTPDFPEYRGQHPPILSVNTAPIFQTELWKLLAAFGHGNSLYLQPNISGSKYGDVGVTGFLYPRACVPYPFMLIQGHMEITLSLNIYHLNCSNCILTNCIRGVAKGEQVIIVKQPAFVMLPVEITEEWYDETALELLQRINTALSRPKRGLSLIILGIVSLITLIATAVTASVSLAQSIQAAHTVDSLSYNVTKVMGTQEDIDKKIEDRLSALYDVVRVLGEQVQSINFRMKIQCHANYKWICVTKKPYNTSDYPWDKVEKHLQGIWFNTNVSLDLLQLHNEILDIENSPKATLNIADTVNNFLQNLFSNFPSLHSLWQSIIVIAIIVFIVIVVILLVPCLTRGLIKDFLQMRIELIHMKYRYMLQYQKLMDFVKKREGSCGGQPAEG